MNLHNPDHPFWITLKTAVVGIVGLGALYITATQFDETEIKAWVPAIAAIVGSEYLQHRLRKKQSQSEVDG